MTDGPFRQHEHPQEPASLASLDSEDIYAFNAAKAVEVELPWTRQRCWVNSIKPDLTT